jgi:structure-specific endonuclease subunit SLX1
MRSLLTVPPFHRYPLHVRFFTAEAQDIFNALEYPPAPKPRARKKVAVPPPPPLPDSFTMTLDLGGVSGQTGDRRESTSGVTALHGPIDVKDREFRGLVWDKWGEWKVEALDRGLSSSCEICKQQIDTSVSVLSRCG